MPISPDLSGLQTIVQKDEFEGWWLVSTDGKTLDRPEFADSVGQEVKD